MPDAQGSILPEGDDASSRFMGEGRGVSGGVWDHGTYEEDGPVTWEALTFPRETRQRGEPDPSPTRHAFADARMADQEQASASRSALGKGNRSSAPTGVRESEGCIRVGTSGNG